MDFYYSSNRNVQMLISILKENNIKKVVVSPGATNICFVASIQQDDYFELFSVVDERNAAYMACGLAMESGEPVVITCTGATASRNYLPGLSEAYYRKLPIIAITGSQEAANAGHLIPQFIDRSEQPKDVVKLSVHLQEIKDKKDEWDCNVKINKAILECQRNGGGPVHINLTNHSDKGLIVKELPSTRVIRRYTVNDNMPNLGQYDKIAITVGAHKFWSDEQTRTVERFCEEFNAVVFVDHSSNYYGKYRVLPTIAAAQEQKKSSMFDVDLLIHIGENSGDYYTFFDGLMRAKEVWRVSEDGEIRDTFKKLTKVFEMTEQSFFSQYTTGEKTSDCSYYEQCKGEIQQIYNLIPELPLSNIWLAQCISKKMPANSVLQLGVSNTMRAWTFFELPENVHSIANIGCRGIDGTLSSVIGMSLVDKERLHFCVLGDLTFFYNMNALAEFPVCNNLRILLVNNDGGAEFHLYQHQGRKQLGENVSEFVAAKGHFGRKSLQLVKHYAQDLGFEYYSASTKEDVEKVLPQFLNPEITDRPMLFEVFTEHENESDALKTMRNLLEDKTRIAKDVVKTVIGKKGTDIVKKLLK